MKKLDQIVYRDDHIIALAKMTVFHSSAERRLL